MTQAPPPQRPAPAIEPERGGRGLAIGALVLGIVAFLPCIGVLLGIVGVVLGILALATKARGRALAISGIILAAVGMIATVFWVGLFIRKGVSKAKTMAGRAMCTSNVMQINTALQAYALSNNDTYPADLNVLVTQGSVMPMSLKCMNAQSKRPCDYFYLPPPKDRPPTAIIICEFKGSHPDGRSVGRADGSVAFMAEEDFQDDLAMEENAAFAAALRKAEGP